MASSSLNTGQRIWRTIVVQSRESKGFMLGFTGICLVLPWAVAEAFIWMSTRNQEKLEAKIMQRPRSELLTVTSMNNQRLAELLDDIKNKRNIDDRYAAALRGEIMTGPPEARKIERPGTSQSPPPEVAKGPLKPQLKA